MSAFGRQDSGTDRRCHFVVHLGMLLVSTT
jgi:hypothetical protein